MLLLCGRRLDTDYGRRVSESVAAAEGLREEECRTVPSFRCLPVRRCLLLLEIRALPLFRPVRKKVLASHRIAGSPQARVEFRFWQCVLWRCAGRKCVLAQERAREYQGKEQESSSSASNRASCRTESENRPVWVQPPSGVEHRAIYPFWRYRGLPVPRTHNPS